VLVADIAKHVLLLLLLLLLRLLSAPCCSATIAATELHQSGSA
jgi:hypothetical protein